MEHFSRSYVHTSDGVLGQREHVRVRYGLSWVPACCIKNLTTSRKVSRYVIHECETCSAMGWYIYAIHTHTWH